MENKEEEGSNEEEKIVIGEEILKEAVDRNIIFVSISSIAAVSVFGFVLYKTVDQIVHAKIIESWTRSIRSISTAVSELLWGNTDVDLTGKDLVDYLRRLHVSALKEKDPNEAKKTWAELDKLNLKARLEDEEPLLWVDILSSWGITEIFSSPPQIEQGSKKLSGYLSEHSFL